jgi:hypothetical protein
LHAGKKLNRGEKMKTKFGMRALGLLLVVALAGAVFVPAVSASNEVSYGTASSLEESKKYLTPEELENAPSHEPKIYDLRSLANTETLPELNNKQIEFIYSVFKETDFLDTIQSDSGGIITVKIQKGSLTFFSKQSGEPAKTPEFKLTESIKTKGPIFVLWAPKDLIEISETDDSITLKFPKELLIKYEDIADAQNSIAESREVNLQITSDTLPTLESSLISKNLLANDFQERSMYSDSGCADQINGITGKIYPGSSYNNGESYFSYHEAEIFLSRPPYTSRPDTIEFISYHRTDNQKRAFVAVWDEGTSHTVLDLDATSITYLEYYLYIENSGGWTYWIHFRNPSTGTWYTTSYDDSDNPSYYVKELMGSTELLSLQNVPPAYSFQTITSPIRVDLTRTTSDWATPQLTLSWDGYTPNEQYVDQQASWNGNQGIDTSHYCGSSIA